MTPSLKASRTLHDAKDHGQIITLAFSREFFNSIYMHPSLARISLWNLSKLFFPIFGPNALSIFWSFQSFHLDKMYLPSSTHQIWFTHHDRRCCTRIYLYIFIYVHKGTYHSHSETLRREQGKFPSRSENDLRKERREALGFHGAQEVGLGWWFLCTC